MDDLLWHLENDGKHIQRRRTAADGELVDAALNEWREAVAMFSGARISSAVIPWDSWSACRSIPSPWISPCTA
jgi:hypothetical protein